MTSAEQGRRAAALDWARRIDDPDFADWEGHVRWLEADPANPDAFDAACALIARATDGLAVANTAIPAAMPVNDNSAPEIDGAARRGWRLPAGIGIAAAAGIVALVAMPSLMPGPAHSYAIETAAGRQRTVALADGTRIALNGASRIRLDRGDPRTVTMEQGEALFEVAHDAAHPFAVRAGGAVFQDVGTAFDVIRSADATEVAVREGAVMFDPAGDAVQLNKGQSILIARGGASVHAVDATSVGGWRQGRLSYADSSLATVARDVARSIGQPVAVDSAIADRRFTGVVVIEADRAQLFRRLAAVAGVSIRRDGAGWRMASPTR